jgi:hypothetical protein
VLVDKNTADRGRHPLRITRALRFRACAGGDAAEQGKAGDGEYSRFRSDREACVRRQFGVAEIERNAAEPREHRNRP